MKKNLLIQDEWNKKYKGLGDSGFLDMAKDGNDFILVGSTGRNPLEYRLWIIKVDEEGKILWQRTFGGKRGTDNRAWSVDVDKDGYIVGGITNSFGHGDYDFWIIKIDKNGNVRWNKTYGGKDLDWLVKVIKTKDGYVAIGHTYSFGKSLLVLKLGKEGNVIWQKTYQEGRGIDGSDVIEIKDDYIISGIVDTSNEGWDVWAAKIDEEGNILWNRTYGWWNFEFRAFIRKVDDGYVIAGYTDSTSTGNSDAYLIKIDDEGNVIWKKKYGGWNEEQIYDIEITDNGYVLCGVDESYNVGGFDAWLLKVDKNGNEIWNKSFGGRGEDYAEAVIPMDNGYIWAGTFEKVYPLLHTARESGWLVKCDDEMPPKIKIIKPKENSLYIFDREIMPYDKTIVIEGITVVADSNSSKIKRVEFYVISEFVYDYNPRRIDYSPPYKWKCKKLDVGLPILITVAAYYGNAGAVAVDKIELYIINPFPAPSSASMHK